MGVDQSGFFPNYWYALNDQKITACGWRYITLYAIDDDIPLFIIPIFLRNERFINKDIPLYPNKYVVFMISQAYFLRKNAFTTLKLTFDLVRQRCDNKYNKLRTMFIKARERYCELWILYIEW